MVYPGGLTVMKRKRYSEPQIVFAVRQAEAEHAGLRDRWKDARGGGTRLPLEEAL